MKKYNPLELNKKTVKKLNQFEMDIVRGGLAGATDVTDTASSCCDSGRTCTPANGGTCSVKKEGGITGRQRPRFLKKLNFPDIFSEFLIKTIEEANRDYHSLLFSLIIKTVFL